MIKQIPRILASFLFIVFFFTFSAVAQIDQTFWFAAPDVSATHGDEPIAIRITAFTQPATVVISMPANPAFTPITLNVAANSTISQALTASKAAIETPFDGGGATPVARSTGILVRASANIAAYYEVNRGNNPDIFALKGRNALGDNFYLPLQNVWNHQGLTIPGRSGFIVVATEDNTTVTITPTRALEGGRAANTPYTVTLNRGQSYAGTVAGATGANMPSGTRITSNKPVAVTMFHDSINTSAGGCYDLVGDQLVPVNILGTEYIVMRTFLGSNLTGADSENNPERVVIMATQATTTVTVQNTGAPSTINLANPGNFQVINLLKTQPVTSIKSNKPIYVFHFGGFGCETGGAILPPIECTGSRRVQFVRSTDEFFGMTILTKDGNQENFSFNGGPTGTTIPSSAFTPVPGLPGWVSARIDNLPTSVLAANAAGIVTNSTGLFHLGIINGGASSGTRYGYFSSFNSVNLGPDINVAFTSEITLDAGPDGVSYRWSTGATTQSITIPITAQGLYWVEVDIGGCVLRDEICIGTLEFIWQGDISSDMTNLENWARPCGIDRLPTCDDDVIIPTLAQRQGTNWPVLTGSFNARDIWIYPTGQLNIEPTGRLNVCRHFRHEGVINASPAGTIAFVGTRTAQNYLRINTTAVGEFPNVVLNNTTVPVSIQADSYLRILDGNNFGDLILQPGSTFHFQSGYVITEGTRELVIRNRAVNAVTGYNAQNFVAGRIRRFINATGSYDLPVGITRSNITQVTTNNTGTLNNMEANDWQRAVYSAGIGETTVLNFNEGISGDAVNEFIQLPTTVRIGGNSPRTVEFWARPRNFTGERGFFALGRPGTELEDFALTTAGANSAFRAQHGSVFSNINHTSFVPLVNQWAHYALTFDGTTVRLYINGNLEVEGVRAINTSSAGTDNFIARWMNQYFNGQIDEVRIWNVARTQFEINTFRNLLLDRCNLPAGLIAYYDFEEGTGNVVNHRINTCINQKTYQLANVNFITTANVDNLLAYFNPFTTAPVLSGLPLTCGADFNCQMLNHGFWTINAFNTGGTQVTSSGVYDMTLHSREYTNFGIACNTGTTVSAAIIRRANGSSAWQIPPGFCIDDSPNRTIRGGMFGFSDFGIGQSPNLALLPVELIDFNARKQEKSVLLQWQTVNESNFSHFILEKSRDGSNFFELAKVNGKGSNGAAYDWTDTEPASINYYRLRMVDKDKTVEYSKIVVVTFDDLQKDLQVYPNPLTKGNGFFVNEAVQKISHITVHNLLGQLVYQGAPEAITEKADAYVPASMGAGVYLVQIMLKSGDMQMVRLIVQ